jgi:hypothetical protein
LLNTIANYALGGILPAKLEGCYPLLVISTSKHIEAAYVQRHYPNGVLFAVQLRTL